MKTSRTALIFGFALAAFTSLAQAQVYLHTQDVWGRAAPNSNPAQDPRVVTRFHFAIDLATETLTVIVDNTVPLANGVGTRGTVVAFGFNTPFTSTQLTAGNVNTTAQWLQGRSFGPTSVGGSGTFWEEHEPYVIHDARFNKEFGVSIKDPTPNVSGLTNIQQGVRNGEIAMFQFKFTHTANAITQSNYKNFFGTDFISVYWEENKEYYKSGNQIKDRRAYSGWDKGDADFWPPSDGDLPATPEPSTYGLMGAAALLGLVAHRRRKAAKAAKIV